MSRYITIPQAAERFSKGRRTIELWIGKGFIRGYRQDSRTILVSVDEIEAGFKSNPRMRDGRKLYGENAEIVPLPRQRPVRVEAYIPEAEQ